MNIIFVYVVDCGINFDFWVWCFMFKICIKFDLVDLELWFIFIKFCLSLGGSCDWSINY